MHVNLLPAPFVLRRLLLRRLYQWGFAFGILTLTLLAFNVPLLRACWSGISDLRACKAAAIPVHQIQDQRISTTKQLIELEQKVKQLTVVANQDRSTSLLGIVASSVRSAGGGIQLQDMRVAATVVSNDSPGKARDSQMAGQTKSITNLSPKGMEYQYQLKLKGIVIDSNAITTFMESLQRSGVFPKVQLVATQGIVIAGHVVHEFQLECLTHE